MTRLLAVSYVVLVISANWLAAKYRVQVPLTDYIAPAGVFAIGAVLVVRDWLQQLAGLLRTMALVYVAGILSYLVGEAFGWTDLRRIAIASVVAFTVSETVEAVVFTPIRRRSLTLGVALSASVGLVIDSLLFLWLAFGNLAFLPGQVIGKWEMVALGSLLTLARRRLAPTST